MKSHELTQRLLELPNMDVAIPVENKDKEYSHVVNVAEYKDEQGHTLVLQTSFEEEDQLDMTGFIADMKSKFS